MKKYYLSQDPELSDELLMARVMQRDVAAFTLLYDRYVRLVFAMAVHMSGRADAEEIVQEIFLRLWNRANQFDPARGSFKAWFMSIARYRILDELRRRNQRQQMMVTEKIEELLANAEDPRVNIEQEMKAREHGAAIVQALKTLPVEQRRVLILAYFGGLSQSAIARQLGWPLGTVKKRVRLGLQKLRAALRPERLTVEVQDGSSSTDVG